MKSLSVLAKYNLGMLFWASLYVALVYVSVTVIRDGHLAGPELYALAIAPSLPIGATLIIVLRYMDKIDEYLRGVLTKRFVVATMLTLFVCTALGFWEANAEGPHFPLYLVYALFWGMFGATALFIRGAGRF